MVEASEQTRAKLFYQCLIHSQISGCPSSRPACWVRRYSPEQKPSWGSQSVGQTGISQRPRKIKMEFILGAVSCGIHIGDFRDQVRKPQSGERVQEGLS